jgi:predicted nucleic acid-binding protein
MIELVVLDTGPLGLLTHPRRSVESEGCSLWLERLLIDRVRVVVPEIADYELRREYLLRQNWRSLTNLETLGARLEYVPLSTVAMRRAAQLWAQTRQNGRPTSHPKSLDADCILVAQSRLVIEAVGLQEDAWRIATTDVGDLPRMAPAARWPDIV